MGLGVCGQCSLLLYVDSTLVLDLPENFYCTYPEFFLKEVGTKTNCGKGVSPDSSEMEEKGLAALQGHTCAQCVFKTFPGYHACVP